MSDLFELSMPWWEFVLRATVVYLFLLVLVRLAGKRTVGQYTPFDLILVVLLGNAAQNSLLGDDHSLLGGLLLVATLIALNWVAGAVAARSRKADRLFAGRPQVLASRGEVFKDALLHANISDSEFREAMREHECTGEAEIRLALLETNGRISILKYGKEDSPHREPRGAG